MQIHSKVFLAKSRLSRLLETGVGATGPVTNPAVLLAATQRAKVPRTFGRLKGKVRMADDFDAPLPDDVIALFERR